MGTLEGTLTTATPLILAALGETIVQKSGIVNVGLEGMMLIGAFVAAEAAIATNSAVCGIFAAAGVGILVALLFAMFVVRLAANQVVVGVVINLLALGLTGTLYRYRSHLVGAEFSTPGLPAIVFNQSLLTLAALLAVPAVWWVLNRTRTGLELRACGEQPAAAEASGIGIAATRTSALIFGGVMAGIAGAFLSVGDVHTFGEGMTDGRGFIALAIVTSGRWNPWGCLIAALLFGFVAIFQFQLQAMGYNLPYQLFLALPYVATLAVLTFGGRWTQAPMALGRPYRRA